MPPRELLFLPSLSVLAAPLPLDALMFGCSILEGTGLHHRNSTKKLARSCFFHDAIFYALGTFVSWRNLAILGSIPSLLVLHLLFFIPESPRWLAKVGREKEVEAVLLSLRGANSDVSDEAEEILEYTERVKQQQDIDGHGFFKLFQQKYAFSLTENHCWETGTPILALISVTVYFGSYGIGMGAIPWIIASEIYPVDVKGAAGTVCNVVSSISAWLVAYSFNFLLQWSSTGTFLMFATVTGLGFVFIAKLIPETKGKSLEEIQSLFTDSTIF
ncbi:unnamed protein product [Microthlaspi erraticum]|uniref:Major facilitator superfamily (MFS) profile domain-containing protein n=1 Tax=Microthlaspi erraticum TaxID=1685480 RepID=A0A6D2KLY9_9BRAS|nr:unnamed protein product [Microthlaspi erraticum]